MKTLLTELLTEQLKGPLKKAYDKSLENDKIQLTQISTLSGVFIFISSIFVDAWAISSIYEVLLIRVFMVCCLLLTFASTFSPAFFIKNYRNIMTVIFLLLSFSIEYAIYISEPSDLAYYTYFAVLITIIMVLYSWTYLSTINLFGTSLLIIGGYIFAIFMHESEGTHNMSSVLIVTVTLMLGATFIGYIGKLIRDKHLREKFLLQQSLKNSFEEKVKEAETHEYYANHDALTGLPNRRFAEKNLNNHLDQAKQLNMIMVLLFLDLNGFKKINDKYGHDAGDEILKVSANRLKTCLNQRDILVRLGGDEFLICLTLEKEEFINSIKSRIETSIMQPILFEGNNLEITASIGTATSIKDGSDIDTLISIADKRMYQEKAQSKKVIAFPNDLSSFSKRA